MLDNFKYLTYERNGSWDLKKKISKRIGESWLTPQESAFL